MRAVFVCLLLGPASARVLAGSATYALEPSESSVTIQVGRAGLLKFAGHGHEVDAPAFRGEVVADAEAIASSSVWVEFTASSLKVSGKGEPAKDVPKVQEAMVGPTVLEVARYPTISFRSRSVDGRRLASGVYEVVVHGDLSLHGTAHAVDLPLRIEMNPETLKASGRTTLRHTDFGMKPISVGGVVNVKNEIGVELRVVARKKAGS